MSVNDIIFYILDLIIFVMLVKWLGNTKKIKIHSQVTMRWIVPALFLAVAVIGFFRYTGIFRIIQTICLVVFALMYYFTDSGLSEEGVVMMGSLTAWNKTGKIAVNKRDHNITFHMRGREGVITFAPEQMQEVREFIASKARKS